MFTTGKGESIAEQPPEYIYVDKDMKPCLKTKLGARRAKYKPEYDLYVIEL